jgi:hypothetical protein
MAGSIPDGVIRIFHGHKPSGRTIFPRPVRKTYHLHVPIVLKSGGLNFLETSGTVQACNGTALPLYILSGMMRFVYVFFVWIHYCSFRFDYIVILLLYNKFLSSTDINVFACGMITENKIGPRNEACVFHVSFLHKNKRIQ